MDAAERPLSKDSVERVFAVSPRLGCVEALLPRRFGGLVAVGASQGGGGGGGDVGGIGIGTRGGGGTHAVAALLGG